MKMNDVEIGEVYIAKISGRITTVRIDGVSVYGGWDATNLRTQRSVRIESGRRLRGKAAENERAPT